MVKDLKNNQKEVLIGTNRRSCTTTISISVENMGLITENNSNVLYLCKRVFCLIIVNNASNSLQLSISFQNIIYHETTS